VKLRKYFEKVDESVKIKIRQDGKLKKVSVEGENLSDTWAVSKPPQKEDDRRTKIGWVLTHIATGKSAFKAGSKETIKKIYKEIVKEVPEFENWDGKKALGRDIMSKVMNIVTKNNGNF
jgi:hypothetical protein